MKLTIHRGTNQIGGCVTEIESNGYRVFIDFGEQLPGMEKIELPPIDGLTFGDISKSALFITHYHGDHIGKISDTVADLPIYVGKTGLAIYNCLESRLSHIPDPQEAEKHQKIVERIRKVKIFEKFQKIKIGEISITPLVVDHSAFDAYMFVVEADNKRILHTGDFRGHGFRSDELVPMLEIYAKDIDYIISEGSNIQRPNAIIQTEQKLQEDFKSQFKEYKYNFVLTSSTNIDRIFSLYHAAKDAKRCFVCDDYQTKIMKIVSENHKQELSFYDIDYEQKTNSVGRFFDLRRYHGNSFSFAGKLKPFLDKHGFCMLIRSNDDFNPILEEYVKSNETKIYYSMWNGYLDAKKTAFNESLYNFLKPYQYEVMHTSGHADIQTLNVVFEVVNPKGGVLPIHTDAPEKFQELFSGQTIIPLKDGEVFDCNISPIDKL